MCIKQISLRTCYDLRTRVTNSLCVGKQLMRTLTNSPQLFHLTKNITIF